MGQAPVVVGTDFSAGARIGVARAAALAARLACPLMAVHVVPSGRRAAPWALPRGWSSRGAPVVAPPRPEAARVATGGARERLVAATEKLGVTTRRIVRVGSPAGVLLEVAGATSARLIVVGVRPVLRPFERFFLGSTAERVLRNGRFPVLLARNTPVREYGTVLVPVEIEAVALRQALLAGQLAPEARFVFGHFLERLSEPRPLALGRARRAAQAIAGLVETAKVAADRCEVFVREGDARGGILELARRRSADLIVMGTRARRGAARWVLGSVAEYVLRAAKVDVLAVP